jgi:hypothetical protein
MKKLILLALAVCFVTSWAFAQEAVTTTTTTTTAPAITTVTLNGDIIDNMCANANKGKLAEFVKTHTKECVLSCASSGYAIVSDGKLYLLDTPSSIKVEEFLKNPESKLQVEVTALQTGDKLSLISIKN